MKYDLTGFWVLFLMTLSILGCNPQEQESTVEVDAVPPNLEISNNTNTDIFFQAIENETAARIRLANPCNDFQPNLDANTSTEVPYEDIMGYDEDAELVFFRWTNCNGASESDTYALYP